MIGAVWRKLFYSTYFFTIGLRSRTEENIVSDPVFRADHVMKGHVNTWQADPILVDYGEKTYLFYEAVTNDKGRIEVAEVNPDCTVGEPKVLLSGENHYSYPFVFQHGGIWYMIPESSAEGEVCLYEAVEFPCEWKKNRVLLQQASVDTTVFEKDGQMYLLTFLLCPGSEAVIPQAYRMDWVEDDISLTRMEWKNGDGLNTRGAGPVFAQGSRLYRPAQRNQVESYGNAVAFYEIGDLSESYQETEAAELKPEQITAPGIWFNGLHTYAGSERFEAIDIRCREFDFWKIAKVFHSKLRK